MPRKSKQATLTKPPDPPLLPSPAPAVEAVPAPPSHRARTWTIVAVIGLLVLHYALAARSLLRENPTVDEVAHLPAGITYWQKGTFRLYHHNPPLFKLVAALPVVLARPTTEPIYAEVVLDLGVALAGDLLPVLHVLERRTASSSSSSSPG